MKTREEMLNLLPNNSICAELGVFEGDFSAIIIEKTNPSTIYLVDIFQGEMCSADKNGNNMKTINLDDSYSKLIEKYKHKETVRVIKNTTRNFLSSLEDNYLDFVYIDADHTYDGVYSDLMLSREKVKNNGFITGHDYTPKFQGCVDAVDNFIKKFNLEMILTTDDVCPSFLIHNKK